MENSTGDNFWVPDMPPCPSPAICIIETTIIIAVTGLVMIGNVFNLIVLLSTPTLRNSHGYLLLSLSVADLMTGLVATLSIYPSATFRASPDSWPYGDTACLISAYFHQVGIANSGITLVLLSIERYVAVVHPLRYSRVVTKRVTLICIGLVWLISIGVFSTIFAGFPEHLYFPTLYVCLPSFFSQPILAGVLLSTVVAPIPIITVTSCIVSRSLRTALQGSTRDSGRGLKIKAFRMVQIMTLTLILCYVPFFVMFLVGLAARISIPQVAVFCVYWLLLANSFFNTLIYFKMNAAFRARLYELVGLVASRLGITAEKSDSHSARDNLSTIANSSKPSNGNSVATSSTSVNVQFHDSTL
ncbi:cysteinyl leukotriene receptor 2-like [Patiria miniata]|uniref:G-protein coupled receptors family 1 profile domain-containing protein n=1 Tax=Patiria miniata TaxID=46514 RepID=A0A913Z669_PATMI|nr:cysteinyl leukotriene receptor 2-like [Patiria miniata]